MRTTSSGNSKFYRVIKIENLNTKEKKKVRNHCLKKFKPSSLFERITSSIKNFFCPKKSSKISSFAFFIIDYLIKHGSSTVNLFRFSGDLKKYTELAKQIKNNNFVNLADYDHYSICSALRLYIRETLDGIIPTSVAIKLKQRLKKKKKIKYLECLPFTLEEEKRKLLVRLFDLFKAVSKNSETNYMTIKNILLIVAPTIYPSAVQNDHVREFLPLIDFLGEIYKMDFNYVPMEFLIKM